MTPAPQVAFIGVGNMGGAMAANLLDQGWRVSVADLDAEKVASLKRFGAQALDERAQAAPDLIATVVCVVDAAQAETVLFGPDGLADRLHPGQLVLLCPTLAPHDVESFAARLAARSVTMLDAPMSGGPVRARAASMTLMVAGNRAAYERALPLLEALARPVFYISDKPGDAARTKLVNNLLAGINLVGAAEALALAERLGLDSAATLAVIEQSSGQSWIGSDRMHRAIAGDFSPRAHMTLLEKDTRLALEAGALAGFGGPLGAAASAEFARACKSGLAGQDDGALLKVFRQR